MTLSASHLTLPPPPPRWIGVFTNDEWLVGVHAIGADRLEDLHGILSQVSPAFRESFIVHLHDAAGVHREGAAAMIALARATDEAADRAAAAELASVIAEDRRNEAA